MPHPSDIGACDILQIEQFCGKYIFSGYSGAIVSFNTFRTVIVPFFLERVHVHQMKKKVPLWDLIELIF